MTMVLVAALVGASGCRRGGSTPNVRPDPSGTTASAAPAVPFEVRHDATGLTFFWFDEHGVPHAVTSVDDVPVAHRDRVRVDPASPDQRQPGWVYVADLRTARPDGRYGVAAVESEAFANELAGRSGLAQAMAVVPTPQQGMTTVPNILAAQPVPPPAAAAAQGAAQVTIYGASWCGACHQAAAYLRAQNIPFVEHDIEQEPQAAQDMYARARQQGVPTGSIPIIDIGGRLMVGFNPEAIQAALHRT